MAGAVAASLILVVVMWNVASHGIQIAWLTIFLVVQSLRHASASAFRRNIPTGEAAIPWGRWFSLGSGATALLWGLVPILFFPADSLLHQFFLAAFMAGVAASTAVAHAARTDCYLPSILLVLVPLSCRYIYEGGQVPVAIGIGAIVFAAALMGTARATHNSLMEALKLKFEKNDLVESLSKTRDELQTRVKERTSELSAANEQLLEEVNERKQAEEALKLTRDELEQRVENRTAELVDANERLEREITEHKRTEEALRDSEEQYRLVVDNATEVVFVIQEGRIVFANSETIRRLGYSYEEIKTKPFLEFVHPDDRAMVAERHRKRVMGEQVPSAYSLRIVDKDKRVWWAYISIVSITWQGGAAILVFGTDITELKQAQEELQKAHDQLEIRVAARTQELVFINEKLLKEIAYRSEAEEAHRESEEKFKNLYEESLRTAEFYRKLLDASPDPIVVYDREGIPTYLNPVFTRVFGWTFEEVAGRTIDFVPPESRLETNKLIEKALKGQDISNVETKRLTKDGQVTDVSLSAAIFFDQDGQPAGSVVQLRDITERKQAELALKESEDRYRTLFENSRDAIVIVTLGGRVIDVNQSFSDLVGFSEQEIMTRNAGDLWADPSKRLRWRNIVEREGFVSDYEWRCVRKDGEIRDCLVTSTLREVEDGDNQCQTICRDITEQKRAEEALRESHKEYRRLYEESKRREELYRSLLDSSPDAVVVYDMDGNAQYVNDSFTRIFGWTLEEVKNKRVPFVPESQREPSMKLIGRVVGEGLACSGFETRRHTSDGRTLDISLSASRYHDHEDTPAGMLVILSDITARKQAEAELGEHRNHLEKLVDERTRQLKAAQEELVGKERLAVLGQLTATVSHEIRNPLGTIRTSVFSIRDGIERNEMARVERALILAERNILRCDGIIEELLDFSRVKDLSPTPTDIDGWITEILSEMHIPKEIPCIPDLNSGIELSVDRERLRRAIVNVINNAVQAAQDEKSRRNDISVRTNVVGNRLEIRVTDAGPGIPEDVLDKIFEPLFSTKGFGVGLGLPIVKNIMDLHGGDVEIRTEFGKGSTVTLWLPVSELPGDGE